jgi:hypothetical protein
VKSTSAAVGRRGGHACAASGSKPTAAQIPARTIFFIWYFLSIICCPR